MFIFWQRSKREIGCKCIPGFQDLWSADMEIFHGPLVGTWFIFVGVSGDPKKVSSKSVENLKSRVRTEISDIPKEILCDGMGHLFTKRSDPLKTIDLKQFSKNLI